MPEQQDQRPISIDDAIRGVIADATASAVRESSAELMKKLDSATEAANDAAGRLEKATRRAIEAIKRGNHAIRRLHQFVGFVACMPLFAELAELIRTSGFDPSGWLDVEGGRTIGRLVGAALPLAGLGCWRLKQRIYPSKTHGHETQSDEGS